jgi:hypothetical protein
VLINRPQHGLSGDDGACRIAFKCFTPHERIPRVLSNPEALAAHADHANINLQEFSSTAVIAAALPIAVRLPTGAEYG